MDTKKIIAKTAIGTCAVILYITIFVINILALFFPSYLAEVSDYAGMGIVAVKMSEVAYSKSDDINDLSLYVERSIKYENYAAVKSGAQKLISHDNYTQFTEFKNNQGVSAFSDYKSYVEGNYIISLYITGDKTKCLQEIMKSLNSEYDAVNPVRFLARHLQLTKGSYPEFVALLKNKHDDTIDKKQRENLSLDILAIYIAVEDTPNIQIWREIYKSNKS